MKTTLLTPFLASTVCMLAACVGAYAPAVQAADQDPPAKTVRYDDLDLSTDAGAATLYGRIRGAARYVCDRSAGGDWLMWMAKHSCIDKAIDNAVQHVNSPRLTALRFGGGDLRLASK